MALTENMGNGYTPFVEMYGETENEHEETTLNRLIDMIGKREV